MITSVDEKVYKFFPEYIGTKWVDQKYDITLRHLLTMTAGLDWDERTYPFTDLRNTLVWMVEKSDDWMKYILDRDVKEQPGKTYNYCSGLTLLLSGIVKNISGMNADKFAEKYLFEPLGISDYEWYKNPKGTINAWGGLDLRPRDMAKIGYMMLNDGKWNGKQIISPELLREFTEACLTGDLGFGYGYQWNSGKTFVNNQEIKAFFGWGYGGRFIFVIPGLDLVAVFTSDYENPIGEMLPLLILNKCIIASILPSTSLPKAIKLTPEIIGKYLGEYESEQLKLKISIFSEDGRVYIFFSAGEKDELFSDIEDQFYGSSREGGDFRINFMEDENKKIKYMVVHLAL